MNSANVVMSSYHRTGETFQDEAESSRRHVEATGLKPDTVRIRNPETIVIQVCVGNEVFPGPLIRLEAVGEIAKGSDRHISLLGDQ